MNKTIKTMFLATAIGLAVIAACAACSTPQAGPAGDDAVPAAHVHDEVPASEAEAGLAGRIAEDGTPQLVALPGGDQPPVVVNVWFDASGVWPKHVAVPAGRQVQLVLRNHDQKEHHYHILGLPAVGMLWLSKEGVASPDSGVSADEHAMHHAEANIVPFHVCTSRSGICPTGQWIHAHADPADMDIVIFATEIPGSYEVTDPLHPGLAATVHVF